MTYFQGLTKLTLPTRVHGHISNPLWDQVEDQVNSRQVHKRIRSQIQVYIRGQAK